MLANNLARRGDQIEFVCLSAPETSFYPLDPAIHLVHLDQASDSRGVASAILNNLQRIRKVRSAIRDFDADIAIGVMTTMNVLTILGCVGLRTKVVATEHVHPPEYPLGRLWELGRKLTYARADLVTAPTEETCEWLKQTVGANMVRAIPNPLCVPLPWSEPVVSVDRYLNLDDSLVLAVGRLSHEKGFGLLIPVFANLISEFPNWKLAIVGEGDERHNLEALIEQHGCQQSIYLTGEIGNISQWYERAEVFVMCSRFEGFGNTLAEAMAHGCACLSFDCPVGPRTIIRSEEEGILLPNGNVGALYEAIRRVMVDGDLRSRLQANAELARSRFDEDVIVDQWRQLLVGLV
jgi:glycosyltransferase involved in cell wall biosynthesis